MDERVTNFTKLYSVNVNEKVEKKPTNNGRNLSYLSWAWAWAEFKKIYPNATYAVKKDENGIPYFGKDDVGFMCYVTVNNGEGLEYEQYLPIMDSNNRAMKSRSYTYKTKYGEKTVEALDMFDVNKTIQRCLTKCLAMFGLGLYIYAGEDLPEVEDEGQNPAPAPKKPETKAQPQVKPELDAFSTREQFIEALVGMGTDINKLCVAFNADSIDAISTEKLYEAYCRKFYQMHRSK